MISTPLLWGLVLSFMRMPRGAPTGSTLRALPAAPCGPRQPLQPRALTLPAWWLPGRAPRRRRRAGVSRGGPRLRGRARSPVASLGPWVRFVGVVRSSRPSSPYAPRGTSGWLALPRQGRSPCTKRHAARGALTPGVSRCRKPERRKERRLSAVGCTPLILIEAPSPADQRGMLRVAKTLVTNKEETSRRCSTTPQIGRAHV